MLQRKILHIPDIEQMTGFHRSTLRRKWENGQFPRPILLDDTRLVWHIDTVNQWINEKFLVETTASKQGETS
jgi:prophage regulatory protein